MIFLNILFSIKPCFVEKILNGEKRYEYRRRGIHNSNQVNFAFIYACRPLQKIVAAFSVNEILIEEPFKIWERTKNFSGLTEQEFNQYFQNKNKAYAFLIDDLKIFDTPVDPFVLDKNFCPPQSFYFLRSGVLDEKLCNLV